MDYMRHALGLAQNALGTTSPNPAVGAVLVRDGKVIGEGSTQPAGQNHAEIVALRHAGDQARGGTLYVTLEPCCQYGRTPPCTQAIYDAGVIEVHISIIDPNPTVAGKGRKTLEEAGITVVMDEEATASRRLNEAYFKHVTTGLPFVLAKFATSLDGKIATRTGDAHWITGEAARRKVHQLRAISDAIVVGVGTVMADDPQLTARNKDGKPFSRQPLRVIIDSRGRTLVTARLFKEQGPILLAGAYIPPNRVEAIEQQAVTEVIQLPAEDGLVNLKALLVSLGQREVTSVLVEGGGTLLGSFFDQNLVDKVIAFIAPIVIGGVSAIPAVGGQGIATIAQALRLQELHTERLGEDIMVIGYPSMPGKEAR